MKSVWKPWNYLAGSEDEEGTQAPSKQTEEEETVPKKTEEESKPSVEPSKREWIKADVRLYSA